MSLYQVLKRPQDSFDPASESGAVFIEDRFSWGAALFPPLWALFHGLWLELIVWIAAMVALVGLDMILGDVSATLYLLGALLLGFEAANIRAAALRRKGFHPEGDLIASGEDLAELAWLQRGVKA